ncbi:MAG: hypothetical protein J0L87_12795 [Bacteroidetes bacterium]|nr:hypothetical protein [Bacteroidota bacterium]
MKNSIALILILLSTITFSQNCKYKTNDVDKFTGKLTKLTKPEELFETNQIVGFISIQKIDNEYSLIFVCDGSFNVRRTIKSGSKMLLLLENSKIITLEENNGSFPIKESDLMELMKSKVQSQRFTLDSKDGDLQKDVEIKKGDAIRFMNLIKCVL